MREIDVKKYSRRQSNINNYIPETIEQEMSRLSVMDTLDKKNGKTTPFGNCAIMPRYSPHRDLATDESRRAAQSNILMQAAQNITKSCGKREAGPATFVIRKTNPLTAKKTHNQSSMNKFTTLEIENTQKSLKSKVQLEASKRMDEPSPFGQN